MASIAGAGRYIKGVSKGLGRGDFFPASSRAPVGEAPGGSSSERLVGPIKLGRHRIPVAGLERPIQLVQITDVHLRSVGPLHRTLTTAIQRVEGDVVVLTGDVVAREWTRAALDDFLAKVPRGRLGTFAALGNWEHWQGDVAMWEGLYASHGIPLLREQVAQVGQLQLVGLDDHLAGASDPDGVLGELDLTRPTAVLSHSPASFDAIARPGVDLVLSGHTHGGQFVLPGAGALWVPKGSVPYIRGFYRKNSSLLYVSPGLGWSIAPLRIGCPPEIALHILEPA